MTSSSYDWTILLIALAAFLLKALWQGASKQKSKPLPKETKPPELPKEVKMKVEEKVEVKPSQIKKKGTSRHAARKIFLIKTLLTPYR